jgi:tetratricopeptide (TPR) repeat protein
MRDDEEEDFFDDPEFLENFQKYEKAHKNGEPIYIDAEDLTDIAEFYMTQNREEEANEAISLALSLYPDSIDPLIFLSRQQMFHDNLDEAIKIAHSIPDQNDRETIFLWTEILIRSEKPEEALQFILSKQEEMEEDDEDEDMFLYDAACIFMDYQEHEIAQQLISMLEEKFPQNANFRKLKIENLVSMEEFDKAISLMQNFIDEHPYSTSAWRIMAEAHVGKGDFLGALDNIEYCLAINPTSAQALMVKAHCLFHLNQLTQAHEIYLQLQKIYPENGRCYYMDAITLANMEKFSEAKDCIKIALKYTPEYDEERVQVLVHKAYIESKCHNVKKALRALEEAMKLSDDKEDFEFNLLKGEILLENGKEKKAAEYFEIAYNESKNKQQTLLTIGIAYAETMHYDTALSLLQSFTKEYPGKDGIIAIPYLAYCYKKIHDQDNYLKYLRKAVYADREITEFLFAKDYPSIQPEEYYLYAFRNAYGRFPETWE